MKYPNFILFHLCERRLAMDFIQRFFKGFVIGSGAILPGISSGVLCVIFGIYQSMIEAILGIFKDFKKNFCFLFPLGIGGVIGMVLFGDVIFGMNMGFAISLTMVADSIDYMELKNQKKKTSKYIEIKVFLLVPRTGIEPVTRGFSVPCSTN